MMPASTAQPRVRRIDQLSQRTRRVIAVATLVGLPSMYLWSSFWLGTSVPNVIWGPISFVPEYRFGGDAAKAAFGAVHEFDRTLREDYWEGRDLFRDEAP